ncbi:DNA topoisomerase IB [Pararhodobacter zhoushanensis]|uniref:DNA topoisomerase n=1 Tax=Pararhodobacter zhoushanensis TaxID=2479545 RepID=A0ABT3H1F9_9RHOB|nr:DNA topoisomerase IB [Pararhodobacter zhoushanensis]MCW1933674.1 DNA topoisomerase IB [Pararhodobacter zhoushanensis]
MASRRAALVYYPDDQPGIRRQRRGRGFSYYAPDGMLIRDPAERARIAALAVPPAYTSVWISPQPQGHLLATGRDAKGRKQYRYHPEWAEHRAQKKYDSLATFGRCLPRLRARIAAGLCAPAGSRDLALAAVLALLDRAALRIGSADYARENGTHGATTLLAKHIRFDATGITLHFPAKRGTPVTCHLHGPRLQRALHKVQDLPGADLIAWSDGDGVAHPLRSDEVNAVLAEICGAGTSAKTFRTWNGTMAAFAVAAQDGPLTIHDMATAAAERLSNTPAIARKSYIHPQVIALAQLKDAERARLLRRLHPPPLHRLRTHEGALIALLDTAT